MISTIIGIALPQMFAQTVAKNWKSDKFMSKKFRQLKQFILERSQEGDANAISAIDREVAKEKAEVTAIDTFKPALP